MSAIRWVRQEDPSGCGVAVLAMLTGSTYVEVAAAYPHLDFRTDTLEPTDLHRFLWKRGYFLRDVRSAADAPDGVWPPRPFAPLHYLNVEALSGNSGHWIVMDADGRLFDPLDSAYGSRDISEVSVVYEAVGVTPPPAESQALQEAASILRHVVFMADPREREQPVPEDARFAAESWLEHLVGAPCRSRAGRQPDHPQAAPRARRGPSGSRSTPGS